jgi:SWIM zinc finger
VPLEESGCYRVQSVEDPLREPHYVDLHSSDVPRCDCPDFLYRERLCKHILSALLYENHPVAQEELAQFILARRKS